MYSSISNNDENKRRIDREKKRRKRDMLKSLKEKSECDRYLYKKKMQIENIFPDVIGQIVMQNVKI